jgi:hypothetical protein
MPSVEPCGLCSNLGTIKEAPSLDDQLERAFVGGFLVCAVSQVVGEVALCTEHRAHCVRALNAFGLDLGTAGRLSLQAS